MGQRITAKAWPQNELTRRGRGDKCWGDAAFRQNSLATCRRCAGGRGGWRRCRSAWQSSSTTSAVATYCAATRAAGSSEKHTTSLRHAAASCGIPSTSTPTSDSGVIKRDQTFETEIPAPTPNSRYLRSRPTPNS